MKFNKKRLIENEDINAGSMADIAFLLLIFFLVATTINSEKGLMMRLPPDSQDKAPLNEKNVFNILINSADDLMVEGEVRNSLTGVRSELRDFIMNKGRNPNLSESPQKAIISLKTNRGTSYERFIEVLDEIKGTYYQIYSDRVGLNAQQYRSLKSNMPAEKALIDKGKQGIPMNISIAEPD